MSLLQITLGVLLTACIVYYLLVQARRYPLATFPLTKTLDQCRYFSTGTPPHEQSSDISAEETSRLRDISTEATGRLRDISTEETGRLPDSSTEATGRVPVSTRRAVFLL